MSLLDTYRIGQQVLGLDVGDLVPWLGVVGKVAGGAAGGMIPGLPSAAGGQQAPAAAQQKQPNVAEQVKRVLEDESRRREDEQRRAQQEKIDADVRSLKTVLIVLGIGGAGIATLALLRR